MQSVTNRNKIEKYGHKVLLKEQGGCMGHHKCKRAVMTPGIPNGKEHSSNYHEAACFGPQREAELLSTWQSSALWKPHPLAFGHCAEDIFFGLLNIVSMNRIGAGMIARGGKKRMEAPDLCQQCGWQKQQARRA
jgi:hypothetical protein